MPNQPWCLDELALMVASKSTIIPVFHDVDPSELRWPQSGDGVESIIRCLCPCLLGEKGRYARDLHMLQKKTTLDPHTNKKKPQHESSTLQKWRKALSDVSNKSGFVFNAYNGLIAVLSRNLREEFMPFLHKLMETMGNLLESGGDRDPEILEQVFTAFSYILKYMQKLLVKDIAYVMKRSQLKTRNLAFTARNFTILLKCVAMCMIAHIVEGRFILLKLTVQISKMTLSIVERQIYF